MPGSAGSAGLRRSRAWRAAAGLGVTVLLLLVAAPGWAVEEDGRLWVTFRVGAPLWESLRGGLLVQARVRENLGTLERILVRPSLTISLTERLGAGVGYDAHVIRSGREPLEHRIWQQLSLATPIPSLDVAHRLRLEERIGETTEQVSVRLRYRLSLTSAELGLRIRGVVRNEAFFHFDGREPTNATGFAENRAFLGMRRPLGGGVAVELGYQAQWVRIDGARDALAHTLMTGLGVRF